MSEYELRLRLRQLYDTDAEVEHWLATPHRLLGMDRPKDRIEAGRIEDVEALLDQLESGAYA